MTSSLPTAVSCPLLLAVWVIVALRVLWFRTLDADRRLNLVLGFAALACTLREPTCQRVLLAACGHTVSDRVAFQLSTAAIIVAASAGYLATTSWLGHRARSGLIYATATACGAALVWLGRDTAPGDYLIAAHPVATVVGYWTLFAALPYWCCAAVIYTCVTGLRRGADRRDTVMYALGLTLFAGVFVSITTAVTGSLLFATGQHSAFTAVQSTANRNVILFVTFLGAPLTGIPVAIQLLTILNLDHWARRRRELLPMWRDLTSACPEIVHLVPSPRSVRRTRYLLHRTTIEIRDCILILSRYAGPNPAWAVDAVAAATRDRAAQADPLARDVRLVRAIAAKRRGDPVGAHRQAGRSPAAELLAETHELAILARHWDQAKTIVREHDPTTDHEATRGAVL